MPTASAPATSSPELAEAWAELGLLTRALREHLELLGASGASGVQRTTVQTPDEPRPEATVAGASASESRQSAPVAAEPRGTDLPGVARKLTLLDEEVRACTRCALHQGRTQTVFSRGSGRSGICFVGEGPGADEDAQGYPFVGQAGQLLDRMIAAMGFDREDVYVCNIVKCRPPKNRKPELDEMSACVPYLHEQLTLIRPRVIIALGATAVQGLLGTSGGITRLRGDWKLYRGEIDVMPTFHPAYLLRQPSAKRQVWEDLQAVLGRLGLPIPNASKSG